MTQKSVHTFIVDGKKVALHRGHTMFEINCQNGAVKKADMTYDNFVKIREQCVYVPALNIKSAKKKFINFLFADKKQ